MTRKAKTISAPLDPVAWVATVDPARRDEAQRLLAVFGRVTGWEARLWGPSMVGFGRYEYRYDSGHGGEVLATGFAPRKAEIVLYCMGEDAALAPALARLGPHRRGKACTYLRRLDGVDEGALEELIRAGLADLATRWTVHPV